MNKNTFYKTKQGRDLRVMQDNTLAICTMSSSSEKANKVLAWTVSFVVRCINQ